MKSRLVHSFEDIISMKNLFLAWGEFVVGKKRKLDVLAFEYTLADNIKSLHEDLANRTYRHGPYEAFNISDPKPRQIHKASVRDRLLHHAIYRVLYPFFDRIFIADSYSCRLDKGTHKAVKRFNQMARSESRNDHRTCWVLKGDIRKFFASIDHDVLLGILGEHVADVNVLWLLGEVVGSFETARCPHSFVIPAQAGIQSPLDPRFHGDDKVGLPLGNLTSQLFANVYLNELDQWVKHNLRAKKYIRYADDFAILSADRDWLENIIPRIAEFLELRLKLRLHDKKVFIQTYSSGVDFLGWVNFPGHRVLRRATKQRMFARIDENSKEEAVQSYLGMLKHGNAFKLRQKLLMDYWITKK
ncbi:MAG: reverse transcriptase/maturase family protein [Patescibacteria group bacterium]|nr:reverse transcriptase/maturase family protein [Patescibacteria group bacterium]